MTKRLLLGAAAATVAALLAGKSYAAYAWQLNDFENASEFAPQYGWHAKGGTLVSQDTGLGSTSGTYNLRLDANGNTSWVWGAEVEYNVWPGGPPDPIQANAVAAFNWAGSGNEAQSWFEFDVTWIGAENDVGWQGIMIAINSINGWTQTNRNDAERRWGTNGFDREVDTIHVVTPMIGSWSGFGTNKLPDGDGQWFQINIGYSINNNVPAVVHIDNLVMYTPVPEPAAMGLLLVGGAAGLLRRRR